MVEKIKDKDIIYMKGYLKTSFIIYLYYILLFLNCFQEVFLTHAFSFLIYYLHKALNPFSSFSLRYDITLST